jgi:hypothetical protein
MTDVESFDQYVARISLLVRNASATRRIQFCAWALVHFPQVFGEPVWDGLTPAELGRFREILRAIEAAAQGKPLSAPLAATLQAELEAFGPHEDDAGIEIHWHAIYFRSAASAALEYCQTGDPAHVCAVSEYLIYSWDYELNDGSYRSNNVFTVSQMRRELEQHEQLLEGVTGRPTRG